MTGECFTHWCWPERYYFQSQKDRSLLPNKNLLWLRQDQVSLFPCKLSIPLLSEESLEMKCGCFTRWCWPERYYFQSQRDHSLLPNKNLLWLRQDQVSLFPCRLSISLLSEESLEMKCGCFTCWCWPERYYLRSLKYCLVLPTKET